MLKTITLVSYSRVTIVATFEFHYYLEFIIKISFFRPVWQLLLLLSLRLRLRLLLIPTFCMEDMEDMVVI